MIHSTLTVPMIQKKYKTGTGVIKQIATENGYNKTLINNLLRKKQYKLALKEIFLYKQEEYKSYKYVRYVLVFRKHIQKDT